MGALALFGRVARVHGRFMSMDEQRDRHLYTSPDPDGWDVVATIMFWGVVAIAGTVGLLRFGGDKPASGDIREGVPALAAFKRVTDVDHHYDGREEWEADMATVRAALTEIERLERRVESLKHGWDMGTEGGA